MLFLILTHMRDHIAKLDIGNNQLVSGLLDAIRYLSNLGKMQMALDSMGVSNK